MSLLHEWSQRFSLDIPIGFHFRDTIAVIDFTIGTYGDAAKTAIPVCLIWGMSLHEVLMLCMWVNAALNIEDAMVEFLILCFSVMGISSLQDFFAEFEKHGM